MGTHYLLLAQVQLQASLHDLRRGGLEHLARRITGVRGRPPAAGLERAVDLLYAIDSFHTFDDAAGPDRPLSAVAPDVIRLARAALGVTD
jgi:hypothetical protein